MYVIEGGGAGVGFGTNWVRVALARRPAIVLHRLRGDGGDARLRETLKTAAARSR